MEAEVVESVLEKVWDLHDKLSDAIHSNSRTHFLLSAPKSIPKMNFQHLNDFSISPSLKHGYVFTKEPLEPVFDSSVESRSLNSIRSALEHLEDQLEFFQTVQTQQRAEKDAAIARLEQSRIILAMRLAEHQGRKYKVIEEAQAFVGDVKDASRFVFPEDIYSKTKFLPNEKENTRNPVLRFLFSGINLVKRALAVDNLGGFLGNAAVFSVSLLALLHLHQMSEKAHSFASEDTAYDVNYIVQRKITLKDGANKLDVTLARG